MRVVVACWSWWREERAFVEGGCEVAHCEGFGCGKSREMGGCDGKSHGMGVCDGL